MSTRSTTSRGLPQEGDLALSGELSGQLRKLIASSELERLLASNANSDRNRSWHLGASASQQARAIPAFALHAWRAQSLR